MNSLFSLVRKVGSSLVFCTLITFVPVAARRMSTRNCVEGECDFAIGSIEFLLS